MRISRSRVDMEGGRLDNAVGGVPVGTVLDFAGTTAPSGWLLCYGQTVSRTTYASLFDIIGIAYGAGDGSTTFTLPDLRGRTVAGKDDMGGASANRLTAQSGGLNGDVLGATGGAETHVLTVAQLAAHTHTTTLSNNGSNATTSWNDNRAGGTNVGVATNSAGSNAAHNNVQPTVILNKIIYVAV